MRSTYINFALIDTGYTCSSDLGSRLGEKDTAREQVKTNTKCQLILFLLRT
jgi:predicted oxidoreductase